MRTIRTFTFLPLLLTYQSIQSFASLQNINKPIPELSNLSNFIFSWVSLELTWVYPPPPRIPVTIWRFSDRDFPSKNGLKNSKVARVTSHHVTSESFPQPVRGPAQHGLVSAPWLRADVGKMVVSWLLHTRKRTAMFPQDDAIFETGDTSKKTHHFWYIYARFRGG